MTGGGGKLTESLIAELQNYYGDAIRSNVGNLAGMKKTIHASHMHCASNKARPLLNMKCKLVQVSKEQSQQFESL